MILIDSNMEVMKMEKMLQPKYVAAQMGTSIAWVTKAVQNGTIPGVKIGGILRIPESELAKVIEEGRSKKGA